MGWFYALYKGNKVFPRCSTAVVVHYVHGVVVFAIRLGTWFVCSINILCIILWDEPALSYLKCFLSRWNSCWDKWVDITSLSADDETLNWMKLEILPFHQHTRTMVTLFWFYNVWMYCSMWCKSRLFEEAEQQHDYGKYLRTLVTTHWPTTWLFLIWKRGVKQAGRINTTHLTEFVFVTKCNGNANAWGHLRAGTRLHPSPTH